MSISGVYVAITNEVGTEYLKKERTEGYFNQSIAPAMAANKVSFTFDFKGPSFICDTACSSSYHALICALNDFRLGIIENAVVGSTHLVFEPHGTVEFLRHEMLAPDGKCKSFSTKRNGFARSEAVVSIFIQKRNNCRRIYANILGGGINADGHKREGICNPSMEGHFNLLKNTYNHFNINPEEVNYFEAHGTGNNIIQCL